MKIISIDNFGRESVSDVLVAEKVSKYFAPIITDLLNEKLSGNHSPYFYRTVDDNYELYEFKP